jgi:cytochrome b
VTNDRATVKVWDPYVRFSHWATGLLVLGSYLSSGKGRFVAIHAGLGLTVAVLVLARVAWGFVGPGPARFSAFVHRPRAIVTYTRALARGRPPLHLSHNPLGGVMVVALLAVLLACTVTGAIAFAYPRLHGPFSDLVTPRVARAVREVHEGCTGILGSLIGLHVTGVLFSSWREGQNLVRGMVTGRKRAP